MTARQSINWPAVGAPLPAVQTTTLYGTGKVKHQIYEIGKLQILRAERDSFRQNQARKFGQPPIKDPMVGHDETKYWRVLENRHMSSRIKVFDHFSGLELQQNQLNPDSPLWETFRRPFDYRYLARPIVVMGGRASDTDGNYDSIYFRRRMNSQDSTKFDFIENNLLGPLQHLLEIHRFVIGRDVEFTQGDSGKNLVCTVYNALPYFLTNFMFAILGADVHDNNNVGQKKMGLYRCFVNMPVRASGIVGKYKEDGESLYVSERYRLSMPMRDSDPLLTEISTHDDTDMCLWLNFVSPSPDYRDSVQAKGNPDKIRNGIFAMARLVWKFDNEQQSGDVVATDVYIAYQASDRVNYYKLHNATITYSKDFASIDIDISFTELLWVLRTAQKTDRIRNDGATPPSSTIVKNLLETRMVTQELEKWGENMEEAESLLEQFHKKNVSEDKVINYIYRKKDEWNIVPGIPSDTPTYFMLHPDHIDRPGTQEIYFDGRKQIEQIMRDLRNILTDGLDFGERLRFTKQQIIQEISVEADGNRRKTEEAEAAAARRKTKENLKKTQEIADRIEREEDRKKAEEATALRNAEEYRKNAKEIADRIEREENRKRLEDAQKQFEEKKRKVEEASKKVEDAKRKEEEDRANAEKKRKDAEIAQKKIMDAKKAKKEVEIAEEKRKKAEEEEKKAEEERKRARERGERAEQERIQAEESRKKAKEDLEKAEENRKKAEEDRKKAEQDLKKAEKDRKKMEEIVAMHKAEEDRKRAEEERRRRKKGKQPQKTPPSSPFVPGSPVLATPTSQYGSPPLSLLGDDDSSITPYQLTPPGSPSFALVATPRPSFFPGSSIDLLQVESIPPESYESYESPASPIDASPIDFSMIISKSTITKRSRPREKSRAEREQKEIEEQLQIRQNELEENLRRMPKNEFELLKTQTSNLLKILSKIRTNDAVFKKENREEERSSQLEKNYKAWNRQVRYKDEQLWKNNIVEQIIAARTDKDIDTLVKSDGADLPTIIEVGTKMIEDYKSIRKASYVIYHTVFRTKGADTLKKTGPYKKMVDDLTEAASKKGRIKIFFEIIADLIKHSEENQVIKMLKERIRRKDDSNFTSKWNFAFVLLLYEIVQEKRSIGNVFFGKYSTKYFWGQDGETPAGGVWGDDDYWTRMGNDMLSLFKTGQTKGILPKNDGEIVSEKERSAIEEAFFEWEKAIKKWMDREILVMSEEIVNWFMAFSDAKLGDVSSKPKRDALLKLTYLKTISDYAKNGNKDVVDTVYEGVFVRVMNRVIISLDPDQSFDLYLHGMQESIQKIIVFVMRELAGENVSKKEQPFDVFNRWLRCFIKNERKIQNKMTQMDVFPREVINLWNRNAMLVGVMDISRIASEYLNVQGKFGPNANIESFLRLHGEAIGVFTIGEYTKFPLLADLFEENFDAYGNRATEENHYLFLIDILLRLKSGWINDATDIDYEMVETSFAKYNSKANIYDRRILREILHQTLPFEIDLLIWAWYLTLALTYVDINAYGMDEEKMRRKIERRAIPKGSTSDPRALSYTSYKTILISFLRNLRKQRNETFAEGIDVAKISNNELKNEMLLMDVDETKTNDSSVMEDDNSFVLTNIFKNQQDNSVPEGIFESIAKVTDNDSPIAIASTILSPHKKLSRKSLFQNDDGLDTPTRASFSDAKDDVDDAEVYINDIPIDETTSMSMLYNYVLDELEQKDTKGVDEKDISDELAGDSNAVLDAQLAIAFPSISSTSLTSMASTSLLDDDSLENIDRTLQDIRDRIRQHGDSVNFIMRTTRNELESYLQTSNISEDEKNRFIQLFDRMTRDIGFAIVDTTWNIDGPIQKFWLGKNTITVLRRYRQRIEFNRDVALEEKNNFNFSMRLWKIIDDDINMMAARLKLFILIAKYLQYTNWNSINSGMDIKKLIGGNYEKFITPYIDSLARLAAMVKDESTEQLLKNEKVPFEDLFKRVNFLRWLKGMELITTGLEYRMRQDDEFFLQALKIMYENIHQTELFKWYENMAGTNDRKVILDDLKKHSDGMDDNHILFFFKWAHLIYVNGDLNRIIFQKDKWSTGDMRGRKWMVNVNEIKNTAYLQLGDPFSITYQELKNSEIVISDWEEFDANDNILHVSQVFVEKLESKVAGFEGLKGTISYLARDFRDSDMIRFDRLNYTWFYIYAKKFTEGAMKMMYGKLLEKYVFSAPFHQRFEEEFDELYEKTNKSDYDLTSVMKEIDQENLITSKRNIWEDYISLNVVNLARIAFEKRADKLPAGWSEPTNAAKILLQIEKNPGEQSISILTPTNSPKTLRPIIPLSPIPLPQTQLFLTSPGPNDNRIAETLSITKSIGDESGIIVDFVEPLSADEAIFTEILGGQMLDSAIEQEEGVQDEDEKDRLTKIWNMESHETWNLDKIYEFLFGKGKTYSDRFSPAMKDAGKQLPREKLNAELIQKLESYHKENRIDLRIPAMYDIPKIIRYLTEIRQWRGSDSTKSKSLVRFFLMCIAVGKNENTYLHQITHFAADILSQAWNNVDPHWQLDIGETIYELYRNAADPDDMAKHITNAANLLDWMVTTVIPKVNSILMVKINIDQVEDETQLSSDESDVTISLDVEESVSGESFRGYTQVLGRFWDISSQIINDDNNFIITGMAPFSQIPWAFGSEFKKLGETTGEDDASFTGLNIKFFTSEKIDKILKRKVRGFYAISKIFDIECDRYEFMKNVFDKKTLDDATLKWRNTEYGSIRAGQQIDAIMSRMYELYREFKKDCGAMMNYRNSQYGKIDNSARKIFDMWFNIKGRGSIYTKCITSKGIRRQMDIQTLFRREIPRYYTDVKPDNALSWFIFRYLVSVPEMEKPPYDFTWEKFVNDLGALAEQTEKLYDIFSRDLGTIDWVKPTPEDYSKMVFSIMTMDPKDRHPYHIIWAPFTTDMKLDFSLDVFVRTLLQSTPNNRGIVGKAINDDVLTFFKDLVYEEAEASLSIGRPRLLFAFDAKKTMNKKWSINMQWFAILLSSMNTSIFTRSPQSLSSGSNLQSGKLRSLPPPANSLAGRQNAWLRLVQNQESSNGKSEIATAAEFLKKFQRIAKESSDSKQYEPPKLNIIFGKMFSYIISDWVTISNTLEKWWGAENLDIPEEMLGDANVANVPSGDSYGRQWRISLDDKNELALDIVVKKLYKNILRNPSFPVLDESFKQMLDQTINQAWLCGKIVREFYSKVENEERFKETMIYGPKRTGEQGPRLDFRINPLVWSIIMETRLWGDYAGKMSVIALSMGVHPYWFREKITEIGKLRDVCAYYVGKLAASRIYNPSYELGRRIAETAVHFGNLVVAVKSKYDRWKPNQLAELNSEQRRMVEFVFKMISIERAIYMDGRSLGIAPGGFGELVEDIDKASMIAWLQSGRALIKILSKKVGDAEVHAMNRIMESLVGRDVRTEWKIQMRASETTSSSISLQQEKQTPLPDKEIPQYLSSRLFIEKKRKRIDNPPEVYIPGNIKLSNAIFWIMHDEGLVDIEWTKIGEKTLFDELSNEWVKNVKLADGTKRKPEYKRKTRDISDRAFLTMDSTEADRMLYEAFEYIGDLNMPNVDTDVEEDGPGIVFRVYENAYNIDLITDMLNSVDEDQREKTFRQWIGQSEQILEENEWNERYQNMDVWARDFKNDRSMPGKYTIRPWFNGKEFVSLYRDRLIYMPCFKNLLPLTKANLLRISRMTGLVLTFVPNPNYRFVKNVDNQIVGWWIGRYSMERWLTVNATLLLGVKLNINDEKKLLRMGLPIKHAVAESYTDPSRDVRGQWSRMKIRIGNTTMQVSDSGKTIVQKADTFFLSANYLVDNVVSKFMIKVNFKTTGTDSKNERSILFVFETPRELEFKDLMCENDQTEVRMYEFGHQNNYLTDVENVMREFMERNEPYALLSMKMEKVRAQDKTVIKSGYLRISRAFLRAYSIYVSTHPSLQKDSKVFYDRMKNSAAKKLG